ncbi:MAG: argininosuccinate synthase [Dehalococcoidia bacterium]|nr:argininosuccinate synthase [Dehalococcoidia bacterium]
MADKVVLAYSGGVDTSAAIPWLKEKYGFDVITLCLDVGNEKDFSLVEDKAIKAGAVKSLVMDIKDIFTRYFIFPALQADALYEGQYPLATALSRPLMAKMLVDVARQEGAVAVAHGCTGKGNDQVRFDVSVMALAPDLKIIAPAREWGMTREETISYALSKGIPLPVTKKSPFSIDENIWGRSIECGVLEDPWVEPPEEVFAWTKPVNKTPEKSRYLEIGFEKGVPVSLDGKDMDGTSLIIEMNKIVGEHGIGRIDHIENRLVGIKSREVYEAPAATALLKAHLALEALNLSKQQMRFKEKVASEYADMIYNGLWFTSFHQDLAAYVQSSQKHISGVIKLKLWKGNCVVVGRKSPKSLYNFSLATYDKGDVFDQRDSPGFIHIWGLPVKVQAQAQLLTQAEGPMSIPPGVVKQLKD